MQNKRVVVIRNLSHYSDFRFNNLSNVTPHAFGIVVSLTIDHDAMRNTLNREREQLEISRFNWGVIQDIEVRSAKGVWLILDSWKTGRNLPTGRRNDF